MWRARRVTPRPLSRRRSPASDAELCGRTSPWDAPLQSLKQVSLRGIHSARESELDGRRKARSRAQEVPCERQPDHVSALQVRAWRIEGAQAASWWGSHGIGTVPHSLIAAFGGDTVEATRAFADQMPPEVRITLRTPVPGSRQDHTDEAGPSEAFVVGNPKGLPPPREGCLHVSRVRPWPHRGRPYTGARLSCCTALVEATL